MAAKKKQRKMVHSHTPREREPEYMVQINDPANLRKDVLESLKEVILFMQGYEQLRKIQEEKVMLFTKLKADVRELTLLVETKLRRNFPKGKFKPMPREEMHESEEQQSEDPVQEGGMVMPKAMPMPVPQQGQRASPPGKKEVPLPEPEHSELDELEKQLRDIESQLTNLK